MIYIFRTSNLSNLTSLKQVRQAFRIRRKGSTSSVEDDERHLVSTKSNYNAGTSSAGGESSGCDDDHSPDRMDGRMLNGYGRLQGNESGDMEEEDGVLIPHLKVSTETDSLKDRKSMNDNKKSKDKNQRKR